jgi:hypothetical protein
MSLKILGKNARKTLKIAGMFTLWLLERSCKLLIMNQLFFVCTIICAIDGEGGGGPVKVPAGKMPDSEQASVRIGQPTEPLCTRVLKFYAKRGLGPRSLRMTTSVLLRSSGHHTIDPANKYCLRTTPILATKTKTWRGWGTRTLLVFICQINRFWHCCRDGRARMSASPAT